MSQTDYDLNPVQAFTGQLADLGPNYCESFANGETTLEFPPGIVVALGSTEGEAVLPDAAEDKVAGIVVHTHAFDVNGRTTNGMVAVDAHCSVLRHGSIYCAVEETVAKGDPVYYRITADGGDTQLGKLRNDSDGGTAVRLFGARFESAGSTTVPAKVFFNLAEEFVLPQDAAIVHLTDSTGLDGTHNDTLAATAALVTLTDSTGGSGTHDDTLADGLTVTAPAAVTATTPGTGADGTTWTGAQCTAAFNDITMLQARVALLVTDVTVQNQNDSDLAQKLIEVLAQLAVTNQNVSDLGQKVNEILLALEATGVIDT